MRNLQYSKIYFKSFKNLIPFPSFIESKSDALKIEFTADLKAINESRFHCGLPARVLLLPAKHRGLHYSWM